MDKISVRKDNYASNFNLQKSPAVETWLPSLPIKPIKKHSASYHMASALGRTYFLATAVFVAITITDASAGTCIETVLGSGISICSGPLAAEITQSPTPALGGAAIVTTNSGFGITTPVGHALSITNAIGDTDLTFTDINGSTITGDSTGIAATNNGTGSINITTTGTVTGLNGSGISTRNVATSTDVTITANVVTSLGAAIDTRNSGSGVLNIFTGSGAITSSNSNGISALNSVGTDLTIVLGTGTVMGGSSGVHSRNLGTGAHLVTAVGDVTGLGGAGILARNNGTSTTVTTGAGIISGLNRGILVRGLGSGATTITTGAGSVTGTNLQGIIADSSAISTFLTITTGTGTVSGGIDGINAIHNGLNELTITANGDVVGGLGNGITTVTGLGNMANINLNSGANVSSTSGLGIASDAGDSNTTVNTGASVAGEIRLSDGSDNLTFAGGDFSGVTIFDGGDNVSTADGFTDTLSFNGSSGSLTGSDILNWETIQIDSATISNADNSLWTTGSEVGTGLFLNSGTSFITGTAFNLTGNLSNSGSINMQNGASIDNTTINGNYIGNNGQLLIDTVLGDDSSTTDLWVINGNSSGNTTVTVQNSGGTGAQTVNGIEIIQVTGTSTGTFTLNGDFVTDGGEQAVVGGAYAYTLKQQIDGDWALVSELASKAPRFQPGTPIYETFAQNLLSFNTLNTLQQRKSNRNRHATETGQIDNTNSELGGWVRVIGGNKDINSRISHTHTDTDTRYGQVQAGFDLPVYTSEQQKIILGVNGSYGQAETDVNSRTGNGDIETEGYSIGLSATWYTSKGLYADAQVQYNLAESDLDSNKLGKLASSIDSEGFSGSLEIGHRTVLSQQRGITLTPQAQVIYNTVDFDDFTGSSGEQVKLDNADSLKTRFGLSLDHQLTSTNDRDQVSRHHLYAIANIVHEFKGKNLVDVSGTKLSNATDETFGEIGMGGSYNWDSDTYSMYGEFTAGTSLDNPGDSNTYKGTLGFRLKF